MPSKPCTTRVKDPHPSRALAVCTELEALYPDEPQFLVWNNPFELLIAVILSAQTTDAQVNKITPALFACCPDPASLANCPLEDLEDLVRSTGFYRVKARNIKAAGRHLVENHSGQVPATMEELVQLPGVGRKTAGVILHHVHNKPAIIVDTHFGRVMRRLGLAQSQDPVALESEVAAILDPKHWGSLSMRANQFGREFCHSRKPACSQCPLAQLCPSFPLDQVAKAHP